jgi:hypothetical protein
VNRYLEIVTNSIEASQCIIFPGRKLTIDRNIIDIEIIILLVACSCLIYTGVKASGRPNKNLCPPPPHLNPAPPPPPELRMNQHISLL